MRLYHASPAAGLTVLEPRMTAFFGKPKQVCLTALKPMALLYGVKHFEYTYGYTKDRALCYTEYFPGAMEELYRGKQASLYLCSWRDGMGTTRIPNEYVSAEEVPVEEEILVPDVFEALMEEERLGTLQVVRWPEVPEKTRDWIVRCEMREILDAGLLTQESPRSRYMREKYPVSWAMALDEWRNTSDESAK